MSRGYRVIQTDAGLIADITNLVDGASVLNYVLTTDAGTTQTIATDVAFSLTPGTSPVHTFHTGTLTADRALTLSTTGAVHGQRFRLTRTGGGAFNITNALKNLATNQWAEFVFDGSAWKLSMFGSL